MDDAQRAVRGVRFDLSARAPTLLLIAGLTSVLAWSSSVALHAPTAHLDGAFQTASGLFRIHAGQLPGRDFFPYLGLGPLAFLFLPFELAGADLAASVLVSHAASLLAASLAVAFVWRAIWRSSSSAQSLAAGAALVALTFCTCWFARAAPPEWLSQSLWPGNSLRPLRWHAISVFALGHLAIARRWPGGVRRWAGHGALVGAGALWSNDVGLSSAGVFTLWVATSLARSSDPRARSLLSFATAALGVWATLLAAATAGHPLALLSYNFQDVARDQWWLFGRYSANWRIFEVTDLWLLLRDLGPWSGAALVGTAIWARRARTLESELLLAVGVSLLAAGALASIGGHLGEYFGGLWFWSLAVALVGGLRLASTALARLGAPFDTPGRRRAAWSAALVVAFGCALFCADGWRRARREARDDPQRFCAPELGGYLPAEWREYVELARSTPPARHVEEYFGLWSALRRELPSWPVDSVIHALGSKRELAREHVRATELVISTRATANREWQPWNLSQNYWFYAELLRGFEPVARSPMTVLWRRRSASLEFEEVRCRRGKEGRALMLVAPAPGFFEVEVEYELRGAGRKLLMARNGLSYALDADGFVSLDPDAVRATFPVRAAVAGPTPIRFEVLARSPAHLELRACRARRLPDLGPDVLLGPNTLPAESLPDDEHWERGVGRHSACFVAPSEWVSAAGFAPGREVILGDGQRRRIVALTRTGRFVRVDLEGERLDPEQVGSPGDYMVAD